MEIKGKGMQIDTDTLEIQRAKRAAKIASEVSGGRRPHLETPGFVVSKSKEHRMSAWNLSKPHEPH